MADDYGPEPKWANIPTAVVPGYQCTGCFRRWNLIADFEAHICDGKARAAELRKIHEQQLAEARAEVKAEGPPSKEKVMGALDEVLAGVHRLQEENFNLRVAVSDREAVLLKIRDLINKELDGTTPPYLEDDAPEVRPRCRYPENGGGGHVEYCTNPRPCSEHGRS